MKKKDDVKKPKFDMNSRNKPDAGSYRNVDRVIEWVGKTIERNNFTGYDEVDRAPLSDDMLLSYVNEAHKLGLRVTDKFMHERLKVLALENSYHPVLDYFASLKWDGTARLDTWLTKYMGVPKSDYANAVGAITLIAVVRRVKKPGTKYDPLLVFEGEQGTGKSTALKVLARDWFTDAVSLNLNPREFIEQTYGAIIIEVPELAGMRKGEIEKIKATLSRTHDRARKVWGRLAGDVPRQFVLVGTTNINKEGKAEYLKDRTGNRRFWPVRTHDIDLAELERDRDQLWAEAVAREKKGASITLSEDLWDDAERRQEQRMESNPYYDALKNELGGYKDARVLAEDVWRYLKKDPGNRLQIDNQNFGAAMKKLGWKRKQRRYKDSEVKYGYVIGNGKQLISSNMMRGGFRVVIPK